MDWQMPGMDGLEVTRRMRRGEAGAHGMRIPIVALTANAFAEDRAACISAGMNDYLSKPVLADELMAAVRRWSLGLQHGASGEAGRGPAGAATQADTVAADGVAASNGHRPRNMAAAAAPRPAVFDPSVLAALPMVADGSEPQYAQELMAMFLESTALALVDVDHALETRDHDKLLLLVHSLKSSSATVGAMELARLAQTHEEHMRRGLAPVQALSPLLSQAFGRLSNAVGHPARDGLPDQVSA